MTTPTAQYTDFSKDVLGRYVCNGLDEALQSTSGRPDAKPFDIVIVGGGSFGGALAQHLLYSDKFRAHRVLVLEAGPLVLAEHTQNLPTLGLVPPGPTTVDPGVPRAEVWGLPWVTDVPIGFPGLAYCVGGRSLFWGGWSPELLDAEMPASRWPAPVVQDLKTRYFAEAGVQIGVDQTNDFIFGDMHEALRKLLFDGLAANKVDDAIPLSQLPAPRWPSGPSGIEKLEAPLAVQGRPPRAGFFPLNKFSSVPLIMRASRQAWFEAPNDDVKKRVMVVPNCHVTRLETMTAQGTSQVTAVSTNFGQVPVPPRGVVVLAAGTIESTRLALESFGGALGSGLIGTNLISHMRSNYSFRLPRAVVPGLGAKDLQASAMFVKCRKTHADGTVSHFHLQITAAGMKGIGTNSEAELFQKIPDIDTIDTFRQADEDSIVMTVRAVGELQAANSGNRVSLSGATDEFGKRRAFVSINPTANDLETWTAMDHASDQVRNIFADVAGAVDLPGARRDGLGTTHHEGGTLWMGTSPDTSVTTPNGRFHHVVNAYAVGPALLPTIGSPNPMLSGIALVRREAEHLVSPSVPPALESGFKWLFDGSQASLAKWEQAGPGSFDYDSNEQVVISRPGSDIGLFFYTAKAYSDFTLRLQFRLNSRDDNSGVFVRFRDPRKPPPAGLNDPKIAGNTAWLAVDTGFEIQIDEQARPDGADLHRTGAVYAVPIGAGAGQQVFTRGSSLQPGEWNDYEIKVAGDTYTVNLNGFQTAVFTNIDVSRGRAASQDPLSGFIGLQSHTGAVSFRAVRIK
jgi:choline dehydrogenase-like flavoprotein